MSRGKKWGMCDGKAVRTGIYYRLLLCYERSDGMSCSEVPFAKTEGHGACLHCTRRNRITSFYGLIEGCADETHFCELLPTERPRAF